MVLQWPLAGRSEELALIGELARPGGEGTAGVVLAGVAGVGKTRLAREALSAAERRGAATRWVVATASARALPLGAFTGMLGAAGADFTQVVGQAIDALVAGVGPAGVVIGVDDAHLLDDLSALLVQQLVLRRAATVVLTVRSGEPAPDAVTALWKDGHLRRLELQPLSQEDTATLLEAALMGLVDSGDARRLWTTTRGNALFLRHLVEGELEDGRLFEVARLWRWSGHPELSPGLAELIRARIGRMSQAQRAVVEVLALGEPLGVQLLARLTDTAAVEQAATRALIELYADGRRLQARLAHPLYGAVHRDQVGQLRARRLRGLIAHELAKTGGRRADDTLRRAVLMLDSDLPHDQDLLSAAAGHAMELLDLHLGERLARAAVVAGGGFEPQLTLVYALSFSGRGAEADAELARLETLASTDAEHVQALVPRLGNLFWALARPAEGESVLAEASFRIVEETARLELTAVRSVFDAFLGRAVDASTSATAVLASARSSAQAVIFAGWGFATACGGLGRLNGLEEVRQRIESLAGYFTAAQLRMAFRVSYLRALHLAGLLDVAESAARHYREEARYGPGHASCMTDVLCAEVALDRGQVMTAIRWLRQANAGLGVADSGGWLFTCAVPLTQAIAMTGDGPAARQALANMEAHQHPAFVFREPDVLLAHAWVTAAEGIISKAAALARKAADVATSQAQPAVEVVALHTAVCFGDRTAAERLAELAAQVNGPRGRAAAAHAIALAADDGTALQAASVQLEEMGALLLAADAAAQAAAAHTRHGLRGSATSAAARAHRLAQACEGARTPALAAVAAPLPLTGREREIVTLAADGLSNRDIANRLVLSVRTVEGHLYRACSKLGTSNRTDFAALLRGG